MKFEKVDVRCEKCGRGADGWLCRKCLSLPLNELLNFKKNDDFIDNISVEEILDEDE